MEILDLKDKSIWKNCPKGNNPWDKYMELEPEYFEEKGYEIVRLKCVNTPEGFKTAGIQTINPVGEGYIGVTARFHNGESGWPAIWLFNGRNGKYYEIDIEENFNNSSKVKSGLFMYKHMFGKFSWLKRLFRPKVNTPIRKDGWNNYDCMWDKEFIKIYINGNLVMKYKNNGDWKSYPQTEEDRKFTLILSMQYNYKDKARPEQLPLWMDIKHVLYEPYE